MCSLDIFTEKNARLFTRFIDTPEIAERAHAHSVAIFRKPAVRKHIFVLVGHPQCIARAPSRKRSPRTVDQRALVRERGIDRTLWRIVRRVGRGHAAIYRHP